MTVSASHHEPAAGDPLPGSPSATLAWPGPETAVAQYATAGVPGPAQAMPAPAAAVDPYGIPGDPYAIPGDPYGPYEGHTGPDQGADPTELLPAVHPDGPAEAADPDAAPVFVDSSGRRQRRVRRLGLLLAVPAAGYLALLASTVLGGPTVDAPFLPLPPAPSAPGSAPEPAEPLPTITGTPGPDSVQSEPSPAPHAPRPATQGGAPSPAATAPRPATPTAPPPAATPGGNGNGNATATPGHGRPTDAPGNSGNKPTKPA